MINVPFQCNEHLIVVVTMTQLNKDVPHVEKIVYFDLTPNKNIILE